MSDTGNHEIKVRFHANSEEDFRKAVEQLLEEYEKEAVTNEDAVKLTEDNIEITKADSSKKAKKLFGGEGVILDFAIAFTATIAANKVPKAMETIYAFIVKKLKQRGFEEIDD